MKNIITLSIASLLTLSFASNVSATETQQYAVEQDSIRIVTAPKSGLPKASCVFYNDKGERVTGQNVTVVATYDDLTIVEASMYHENHITVSKVICMK